MKPCNCVYENGTCGDACPYRKPEVIGTGIHDLTRREYDGLDRVNFSTLKFFAQSPAHYRHHLEQRGKAARLSKLGNLDADDTDARQRGRAVSLAVFEPEVFRRCVVWSGGPRKGKSWNDFLDRNPDAPEHLTVDGHANAVKIGAAVRASSQAAPLLQGGKGEQTVTWDHVSPPIGYLEGFTIRCKGRPDYDAPMRLIDLKNSRAGDSEGFGREVVRYHSHAQAAMYVDGVKAATGIEKPYFLIVVEPAPPYVVQVYLVPLPVLELGRQLYRGWLDRLHLCLTEHAQLEAAGKDTAAAWPGYATAPMDLELPRWAMPPEDEDPQ